ncbi:MAG TPA: STAS domain-containing protein [Polyangia bacterium]|jgi:anti-sigma B factor antagonist|nr:STAS domain-containing protein [Polyangia bacterium]
MNLSETMNDGVMVVHVKSPRVDAASAHEFRAAIADVAARGHTRLIVDLSAVQFIDSTGLGALVSALKLLGRDGRIVVVGARESVATLFRVTRMDKVFRMHLSNTEAIAALAEGAR